MSLGVPAGAFRERCVAQSQGTDQPSASRPRYVLDSFAVIALLRREAGGADVRTILLRAARGEVLVWMSVVNLGEVMYLTERRSGLVAAAAAFGFVEQLAVELVVADRRAAQRAARVKAAHPVSFADAFAVGLAQTQDAAVVTGDPEFVRVEELVRVHWITQEL